MKVEVSRSGLVEAVHQVAVVAVDLDGTVVLSDGEVDRPFWLRSAAKPFQAAVSQRLGADLHPSRLAVAAASHDGDPVHVAMVGAMLEEAGLDEGDLRCPPGWPLSADAARRMHHRGHLQPRRVWHNCSGKHAAMLRACLRQGWPLDTYPDPDHPLQREVVQMMGEVLGHDPGPVGVDGCGVPVFRGTTRSLAAAYLRLLEPELEPVLVAMGRYPALVSGTGTQDAALSRWVGGGAKRGAEACLGAVLPGRGALAIKVWDGSRRGVGPVLDAALRRLEWVPHGVADRLAAELATPVLGGGAEVGSVQVEPG